MRTCCIYAITSLRHLDRLYIGSTVSYADRKGKHTYLLKNNKHYNAILQNHVNKYGLDDLVFSNIEDGFDQSLLLEREQYYIDLFNPIFNIAKLATGAGNKSRMGKRMTDEQKAKMRLSLLGRQLTPEWKAKIGIANLGKKRSEEFKQSMRKPKSLAHRKALAKSKCKKVIDIKTGLIYASAKEAAELTGFGYGKVVMSLNGGCTNYTGLEYSKQII